MSTQSSRKWEIYTYFMKILMTFWRENIGDISRDLNNCWIVEENSFPSMYHKGFNISRFFCNRLFDDVIYAQSNRTQDAVFKRLRSA